MDRDCDLWIESVGNLKKESQAYGAWIRVAPFVKGRSLVLKVPGFYTAKKAQQKQGDDDRSGVLLTAMREEEQSPTVVQVQTEGATNF